ncbi:IS3 family transposase, partial [Anaerovoracaceae bacterium 42-11]
PQKTAIKPLHYHRRSQFTEKISHRQREWLNRFKIRDYDHAYRLVFEYLEAFYNTKRIHSHCDYMSPNDYEELYRRIQKDELLMAS